LVKHSMPWEQDRFLSSSPFWKANYPMFGGYTIAILYRKSTVLVVVSQLNPSPFRMCQRLDAPASHLGKPHPILRWRLEPQNTAEDGISYMTSCISLPQILGPIKRSTLCYWKWPRRNSGFTQL
jgi:hypothetical protein